MNTVYGFTCMVSGIGAGVGSWMSGFLHDLTGAYIAGFALASPRPRAQASIRTHDGAALRTDRETRLRTGSRLI